MPDPRKEDILLALRESEAEVEQLKLQVEELQKRLKVGAQQIDGLLFAAEESNRLKDEYFDALEWAWSIIASAGPQGCIGNWQKMDKGWVEAAEKWRDRWHGFLRQRSERPICEGSLETVKSHTADPEELRCVKCGYVGAERVHQPPGEVCPTPAEKREVSTPKKVVVCFTHEWITSPLVMSPFCKLCGIDKD